MVSCNVDIHFMDDDTRIQGATLLLNNESVIVSSGETATIWNLPIVRTSLIQFSNSEYLLTWSSIKERPPSSLKVKFLTANKCRDFHEHFHRAAATVMNASSDGISKTVSVKMETSALTDREKSVKEDQIEDVEKCLFDKRTEETSAKQYFMFYGYLSQQQNMLQDMVRTSTYQRAVLSNRIDFADKIVLDVGAGSGILSYFAVQAGAKRVYAVEASSMAKHCERMVRANNLAGRIVVVAGKIEEIMLSEQVDVIISEPMGYMLFNERMLETFVHARKFLRPSTELPKMYPSAANLFIAPFCDEILYQEMHTKANFWYQSSFHGVNLTSLREESLTEYLSQPVVDTFDYNICMAQPQIYYVDFRTTTEEALHVIDIDLEFVINYAGLIHGLAFWFDVGFLGSQTPVWLSTAPTNPLTHWYQVRCLFEFPLFAFEDQRVTGKVLMRSNMKQSYDIEIELSIPGTQTKVSNKLDLKNPCFRYTGMPVQPAPGFDRKSTSDQYQQQQQQPVGTAPTIAAVYDNIISSPHGQAVGANPDSYNYYGMPGQQPAVTGGFGYSVDASSDMDFSNANFIHPSDGFTGAPNVVGFAGNTVLKVAVPASNGVAGHGMGGNAATASPAGNARVN